MQTPSQGAHQESIFQLLDFVSKELPGLSTFNSFIISHFLPLLSCILALDVVCLITDLLLLMDRRISVRMLNISMVLNGALPISLQRQTMSASQWHEHKLYISINTILYLLLPEGSTSPPRLDGIICAGLQPFQD